jgi:hypothetical protein
VAPLYAGRNCPLDQFWDRLPPVLRIIRELLEAETILQFLRGLRGSLHVTLEEGTWATWLHDLLKPHVTRVLVSDPRKNDLGRDGNRNDRRDARE